MPPVRERKRRLREAIIPVINKRLAEMNAKDPSWERPVMKFIFGYPYHHCYYYFFEYIVTDP